MRWRVSIEELFVEDSLGVHIGVRDGDGFAVVEPLDLVAVTAPEAVATPPALRIDRELAHELYNALGRGLGVHTPDAAMATKILEHEQARVDKMLDHLIVVGEQ